MLCYVMTRILGTDGDAKGRRSPGVIAPPLGGWEGLNQQESVAGLSGHSLLTASPYKCGSRRRRHIVRGGVRESVAVDAVAATDTVSQRRVAMEVAGLAVWGGALRRTKLTDEQVPLLIWTVEWALPLELGTIGLYIGPLIRDRSPSTCLDVWLPLSPEGGRVRSRSEEYGHHARGHIG